MSLHSISNPTSDETTHEGMPLPSISNLTTDDTTYGGMPLPSISNPTSDETTHGGMPLPSISNLTTDDTTYGGMSLPSISNPTSDETTHGGMSLPSISNLTTDETTYGGMSLPSISNPTSDATTHGGMSLPSISNPTSDETTHANEIETCFQSDFVCYVDPRTLFPYTHDLLSSSDQDRVETCLKENGRAEAARLFLQLVSRRQDWVSVLKHGLRHDQVQLLHLADKLEQLENCYVVLDNSKAPHVVSHNSQAPTSDVNFKKLRLVLIGPTGTGKSSSGNTILGKYDTFHVGHELSSGDKTCQWDKATFNDLSLEVTDTTGLYLTYGEREVNLKELHKAFRLMTPGPHAFLLVVRTDRRFTEEEEHAYGQLKSHFGQDMTRHMIVIFTAFDFYKNFEEFKETLPKAGTTLHNILQEAGNRWIVFNNTADNADRQAQRENLIEKVKDLVRSNNYSYYSTPQM